MPLKFPFPDYCRGGRAETFRKMLYGTPGHRCAYVGNRMSDACRNRDWQRWDGRRQGKNLDKRIGWFLVTPNWSRDHGLRSYTRVRQKACNERPETKSFLSPQNKIDSGRTPGILYTVRSWNNRQDGKHISTAARYDDYHIEGRWRTWHDPYLREIGRRLMNTVDS